jgi:predicted trehalose synthase
MNNGKSLEQFVDGRRRVVIDGIAPEIDAGRYPIKLKSYLRTMGQSEILPTSEAELELMLQAYLLNKAVHETGYELDNRPAWLRIPVQGILLLIQGTR